MMHEHTNAYKSNYIRTVIFTPESTIEAEIAQKKTKKSSKFVLCATILNM